MPQPPKYVAVPTFSKYNSAPKPKREVTCFKYQKTGHYARECPTIKKEWLAVESPETILLNLDDELPPKLRSVFWTIVNKNPVQTLIDTESTISAISLEALNKVAGDLTLYKTNNHQTAKVKIADGKIVRASETFILPIGVYLVCRVYLKIYPYLYYFEIIS